MLNANILFLVYGGKNFEAGNLRPVPIIQTGDSPEHLFAMLSSDCPWIKRHETERMEYSFYDFFSFFLLAEDQISTQKEYGAIFII